MGYLGGAFRYLYVSFLGDVRVFVRLDFVLWRVVGVLAYLLLLVVLHVCYIVGLKKHGHPISPIPPCSGSVQPEIGHHDLTAGSPDSHFKSWDSPFSPNQIRL